MDSETVQGGNPDGRSFGVILPFPLGGIECPSICPSIPPPLAEDWEFGACY